MGAGRGARGVGLLAYTRPRSARVAGFARAWRPGGLQYVGVLNGAEAPAEGKPPLPYGRGSTEERG